jgi:hypothetical protein
MIIIWLFAAVVFVFGFVVAFGAPYLPSLRQEVRTAFTKLYRVTKDDVVVDLGSGDGVVLLEAARHGARGYGYELNPVLVFISKLRVRRMATVELANMWTVKLPDDTTLVYCFSVTRDSRRLGKMLQSEANRLKRMVRVMTFGTGLKDFSPVGQLNAHSLYEIHPHN